jgi:hypothetical protein
VRHAVSRHRIMSLRVSERRKERRRGPGSDERFAANAIVGVPDAVHEYFGDDSRVPIPDAARARRRGRDRRLSGPTGE